jgi:hypothetical protein
VVLEEEEMVQQVWEEVVQAPQAPTFLRDMEVRAAHRSGAVLRGPSHEELLTEHLVKEETEVRGITLQAEAGVVVYITVVAEERLPKIMVQDGLLVEVGALPILEEYLEDQPLRAFSQITGFVPSPGILQR